MKISLPSSSHQRGQDLRTVPGSWDKKEKEGEGERQRKRELAREGGMSAEGEGEEGKEGGCK